MRSNAAESDILSIREAMMRTSRPMPDAPMRHTTSVEGGRSAAEIPEAVSRPAVSAPKAAVSSAEITPAGAAESFGSEFGSSGPSFATNSLKQKENTWWKGRDSNDPGSMSAGGYG